MHSHVPKSRLRRHQLQGHEIWAARHSMQIVQIWQQDVVFMLNNVLHKKAAIYDYRSHISGKVPGTPRQTLC